MGTRPYLPLYSSILYQEARSWTEDLPVCKNSGIGLSTNVVYREDDQRQEDHEFEDQSFHIKYNDKINLYGVFDGHDGVQFAKYAIDTITAEILLELDGEKSDKEVKQVLKQAFSTVEKTYLDAIGDKLAEKASLQMEIPEGVTSYEAYQKYPAQIEKLKTLNMELSCGTTAVVSLIYNDRLYVANVGDCRALICKTDPEGVLKVIPLSQDHNLSNEDEILRLVNLGIPMKNLKGIRFGNHENTRCLGNYMVKGGYKEFEDLSCANAEPVIAEPEITEGKILDKSYRFLMLMSSGLYRSLEEATGTPTVNKEIAQMVVEQFRIQSTLTGVAQAVVDKVVRIHHDAYMSRSGTDRAIVSKREDITLLIRNFNYPLPHAISPVSCPPSSFESMQSPVEDRENSLENSYATRDDSKESTMYSTETSTEKSIPVSAKTVKPYVDFSGYYARVEEARQNGKLPQGIEFF